MYKEFFESSVGSEKSLEDKFFEFEAHINTDSFTQQFHYAVFYSYLKLREQEIRNIVWIAECISQKQKDRVNNYINIFN
jgi:V-type H+-transporting ATPase subunit d